MSEPRRVCVFTGSRAEFGLLRPVMRAIDEHPSLELVVVAGGSHLLEPAMTVREVEREFAVRARVPMQSEGHAGRVDDAAALGRGVTGCAPVFAEVRPDWVLVLGDRIEAFAAASAASVGGFTLAHVHGGDRAEGIADEAMRHAITKLAHLHLAASEGARARLVRMGEAPAYVRTVGSPALDDLGAVEAMGDARAREVGGGAWGGALLLHPAGLEDAAERAWVKAALDGLAEAGCERPILFMPNRDAGREAIAEELRARAEERGLALLEHLPRGDFLGLLRRLAERNEPLVGNSSAGLIEAGALGTPVVNLGPRQAGRERWGRVADVRCPETGAVAAAIRAVRDAPPAQVDPPVFGDGTAGTRIADALAACEPYERGLRRKRCTY